MMIIEYFIYYIDIANKQIEVPIGQILYDLCNNT